MVAGGSGVRAADRLHAVAITDHVQDVARRWARRWTLLAVVAFVPVAMWRGIPRGPNLDAWESIAQTAALAVLAVGIVVALRWEGAGGSIMLVAAAAIGALTAVEYPPLIALGACLLFLVPAVGFLVAWQRTRTVLSTLVLAAVLVAVLVVGGATAKSFYDAGFGPAHPQSHLPALPDSPVEWMWSGGVTDHTAAVVARVPEGGTVQLVVTDESGSTAGLVTADTTGDVHRFSLDGLEPDTRYDYHFEIDGEFVAGRSGRFRTFASRPTDVVVALGGCARLGSNGLVYEAIAATEPDLFLITGDFFYGHDNPNAAAFGDAYDTTLTEPAQAALYQQVPVAYVWDDHDFGVNDANRNAPSRAAAQQAYRSYVPHYPLDSTGPIHQTLTVGRARFILLDTRSERDPQATPDGPGKSMLGGAQTAWLEDELVAAASQYPIVVLVSSVPWIATPEPGADHWGGYTAARSHLADVIAGLDLDGLVMLAGDAHMVAIDDGTNSDYSATGEGGFPVFHAAALDRPGTVKGGPYSEGTYPGGGQFGLLTIRDDGGDHIEVEATGYDWTGTALVSYTFTVATDPTVETP